MSKTITATYASADALTNAINELVADGLPSEELYRDDEKTQLKVMVPESIEAGVVEIMNRHHPTSIA